MLHLSRERAFERSIEAARPVHAQPGPRDVRGEEKREALDVVPMRVGDEDVHLGERGTAREEVDPERARSRAAIEGDDRAVVGPHLHAAGVAAVERGGAPGSRDRAACAPKANKHSA